MAVSIRPLSLACIVWLLAWSVLAGEHWRRPSVEVAPGKLDVAVASEAARPAAERLAAVLGRMYGRSVAVRQGDGADGIAVGTPGDFPGLPYRPTFALDDPGERQGYEIRTHAAGIYVLGATPAAVDHAVADLLHELGYRFFWPTANWEFLPETAPAAVSFWKRETPDYYTRRIWPGHGLWPDFRGEEKLDAAWQRANRLGGFRLVTGHTYERFFRRYRAELAAHPEYVALVNGQRQASKPCTSNPALQELFCQYILEQFRQDPHLDSVSVEPSDGGGWCECADCAALGTPSTRAIVLANQAATAVAREFPGKFLGLYAYNQHSPPPDVDVHPQVIVCAATMFIRQGYTIESMLSGWAARQATLGIREYYYAGPHPGSGRGSDLACLERTLKDFHRRGARYMTSESSDALATAGLNFYLASRLMWDLSTDVTAVRAEFFRLAFPLSQRPMEGYFQLLAGGTERKMLNDDLLGRMYRQLSAALQLGPGPAERARILELTAYTRFCELLFDLERQETAENYAALLRYAAAIRPWRLVHTHAMSRDHRQLKPAKAAVPEIAWRETPLPSPQELEAAILAGVETRKLLDFTPRTYSGDLRPVLFAADKAGELGNLRYEREFHLWSVAAEPLTLTVTGGLIKHYRDRGPVRLTLIQIGGESETGELETVVDRDASVLPDGVARQVTLRPRHPGLHRLVVADGGDMSHVLFPEGLPVTMLVSRDNYPASSGSFYFYVPADTDVLGFFAASRRGRVLYPDGREAFSLADRKGYHSLPVPSAWRGRVWRVERLNGTLRLLTVPAGLSLTASPLLLPEEVIRQDGLPQ